MKLLIYDLIISVQLWRVEYERDDTDQLPHDLYPATPPSVYVDTEYPTLTPVYPGRPLKLVRSTRDTSSDSIANDKEGEDEFDTSATIEQLESSDTESSEALRRTTSLDREEDEVPSTISTANVDDDELTQDTTKSDAFTEDKTTEESSVTKYIEEAQRKAKELREKSN